MDYSLSMFAMNVIYHCQRILYCFYQPFTTDAQKVSLIAKSECNVWSTVKIILKFLFLKCSDYELKLKAFFD